MDITGKINEILPEQVVNGRNGNFTKRRFVINTGGDYPKDVCFEIQGDNAYEKMKQNLVKDNDVQVMFNAESHEFHGNWYTTLKAYSLRLTSGAQAPNTQQTASSAPAATQTQEAAPQQPNDDSLLPF